MAKEVLEVGLEQHDDLSFQFGLLHPEDAFEDLLATGVARESRREMLRNPITVDEGDAVLSATRFEIREPLEHLIHALGRDGAKAPPQVPLEVRRESAPYTGHHELMERELCAGLSTLVLIEDDD